MKKLIFLLMIFGLSTATFGQFIKKGSVIGGGAFEFRTEKFKDSDSKGSSFALMPWAGYLVIDNLVVGAGLNFTTTSSKSGPPSDFKSSNSDVTFGPVIRYYMDQGLFFHGQAGVGSSKSKFTSGNTTTTNKYGESKLRLGIGYAARITDTVLFEPIIGYYSETTKDKSDDSKSTMSGLFIMGSFTIILKTVQ
ncbi:MAG: outer membrane beta-barrel protein [Cyclobacteriaceae bacterium]|nr:outer membrane beta-barrel protein [Cyclobacteriaceae bacterium]